MQVEVQHAARVDEGRDRVQLIVDLHDGGLGGLAARGHDAGQPGVEGLREIFEEQHKARASVPDRLATGTDRRRAVPEGDGALQPGLLLRCRRRRRGLGEHPPVVQQREVDAFARQRPVGGHEVGGELAPGAKTRRSDPVLVEERKLEDISRGVGVPRRSFDVGQRDLLDVDRHAVELQPRRRAADAGPQRDGPFEERFEILVSEGRQSGRYDLVDVVAPARMGGLVEHGGHLQSRPPGAPSCLAVDFHQSTS